MVAALRLANHELDRDLAETGAVVRKEADQLSRLLQPDLANVRRSFGVHQAFSNTLLFHRATEAAQVLEGLTELPTLPGLDELLDFLSKDLESSLLVRLGTDAGQGTREIHRAGDGADGLLPLVGPEPCGAARGA